MEVNCVLCAVGIEFLCAMQTGFIPQPCHSSGGYLAVSHRKGPGDDPWLFPSVVERVALRQVLLQLLRPSQYHVGHDSSVGTATRYRLKALGIQSR